MNPHKQIAFAAVLICVLSAAAVAQKIVRPTPIETTVSVKVEAVEVSDGVLVFDPNYGESMFGYSFTGEATGDLTGAPMFSMNCFPAQFIAGETNKVTSGSWALPVYMKPYKGLNVVYVGSLFGQLVDGTMTWDKLGTTANITVKITIDDGTGTYAGVSGRGVFQGTLIEGEKVTTLSGLLTLTYNPIP